MPSPVQAPDFMPEWDQKSVVDAGIREDTMVRKATMQEMLDAQTEADAPENKTFQDTFDEVGNDQPRGWQLGTGHKNTDRYAGSRLGAAEAISTGSDVYDTIDKTIDDISTSPNVNTEVKSRIVSRAEEVLRSTLRTAAGMAEGDAAAIAQVIAEVRPWFGQVDETHGFEAITEVELNGLAAVRSKAGNEVLEEDGYRQYGNAVVAKLFDGKDVIGDKGWDWLKFAFAPLSGTTIALADYTQGFEAGNIGSVTNTIGETYGRVVDWELTGKGYNAYKQTLEKFWELPVSKRVLVFSDVQREINKISKDNTYVEASLLMPFVEREAMEELKTDYFFDSISAATLVPGTSLWKAAKFVNAARNARKPIDMLLRTGNADKAYQVINRALADLNNERMEKVTGMTRDEVAHSAHPINASQIVPEQIQGGAAGAARQLEDTILQRVGVVEQAFIKTTDPSQTPVRYYFDDAAKAARQREVLGDLTDDTQVASIVNQTEKGFTVQIETAFDPLKRYDRESRLAAKQVAEDQIRDLHEQADQIRKTMSDEAFGNDEAAKAIRRQLIAAKEQVRRQEKALKALDKPSKAPEVREVHYSFDEAGVMDVEELQVGTMPRLASPSQVVDQLLKGQTDAATIVEFTETKILNTLNESVRESIRGLSKRQLDDLDKLLLQGDESGKVFSGEELINGVTTKWGFVKLRDARQIGAYLATRKAYDEVHRIKNLLERRNLEMGGFAEIRAKLKNSAGEPIQLFVKPNRDRASIPDGVRRVYDHRKGEVVDVSSIEDLTKRLEGEWSVYQFRSGQRFGDEVINYGLVRAEKDVKPLSAKVLSYRNGYVPRQRPGVFYVVQRAVPRMVDGINTESIETARFFQSKIEADEWMLQQPDADKMRVLPDKAYKSSTYNTFDDEFDALNFGGLYSGERTDRTILMGLDGKDAHRRSAFSSLQMYMNHIANRYATNELKMNLIGRFQNTYGKYLINPTNWQSPLKSVAENDLRLKRAITAQRGFIEDMIRMPDGFQQWWSGQMRSIAEAMELAPKPLLGKGLGGKPREWVMNLAAKDPTSYMRAITFHQFLGMFNPSQVFVQGMGFATALAAYPGKAVKLLPKNLALRAAWAFRGDPAKLADVFNSVGVNGDEMADIVREIQRTGLFDSLKTSADYGAGINGINLTTDAVRRALDAGLIFFREGEQWARGYGYLLARDLFMKGKKASYKLTDKDIDQVAKDSMRFTLNLNRSNRAWWQKGVLSIPSQFYQVMAKFTEAALGGTMGRGVRKWTPAEKVKITLGYLAGFGMAGVPFLDTMVADGMNAYKGATNDKTAMTSERINIFNNLPPELQVSDEAFSRFLRTGIVGTMAHWLTGSDPELVSRMSIPAGMEESLDMWKSGNTTVAKALGGAFFAGQIRWLDAAKGMMDIFAARDVELPTSVWKQAWLEMAKVMSSTRNAEKAAWWEATGRVARSDGVTLFTEQDEEFGPTVMWQALGFSPSEIGISYDLQATTAQLNQSVLDAAEDVWTTFKRNTPDKAFIDTQQKRDYINALVRLRVEHLPTAQQDRVITLIQKRLGKEPQLIDIIADAVAAEADADGQVTPGMLTNPYLIPEE